MEMTIESLYEKYAAYVRKLHQNLDAIRDPSIPEPDRPSLLSLEDFCVMWERWGRQDGLQERWLHRFVTGYERDVAETKERLAQVLGVSLTERSAPLGANEDKAAA